MKKVAGMMGINTKLITAMSWGLAGGLGALAASLYGPMIFTLTPDMMVGMQVNGFLAGVLGGFSTFGGPIFCSRLDDVCKSSIEGPIIWDIIFHIWQPNRSVGCSGYLLPIVDCYIIQAAGFIRQEDCEEGVDYEKKKTTS